MWGMASVTDVRAMWRCRHCTWQHYCDLLRVRDTRVNAAGIVRDTCQCRWDIERHVLMLSLHVADMCSVHWASCLAAESHQACDHWTCELAAGVSLITAVCHLHCTFHILCLMMGTRWLTLVLTGVNKGSWDCPRLSQGDIWSVLHLIWIWMRLVFAGISWMVAIDQRFIEMIRTVSGDSGRRSGGPPASWAAPTFLPGPEWTRPLVLINIQSLLCT